MVAKKRANAGSSKGEDRGKAESNGKRNGKLKSSSSSLVAAGVGISAVIGVMFALKPATNGLKVLPLERVAFSDLTMERFLTEYSTLKPVVITDAWPTSGWRPADLAAGCPNAEIRTFRHERGSKNWANNVQVGTSPLREYVASYFEAPVASRPDPVLYGFEMELVKHCPEQLDKVRIPQFFAEDAFHHITNRTGLGWPSVLLGPQGSVTGLHIDTHQLPFWIAVVGVDGTDGAPLKRFRVFPPGDSNLLKYGGTNEKSNYHFTFDPWEPNYRTHPDVGKSYVYETQMRSGDLLYIPGGSPHAVKNIADNLGVSMNFLDLKSMPNFVRKCNAKSPLCNLLAGKGAWVIDALEKMRSLGKTLTYFEFAGIQDKEDFCKVHSGAAALDGSTQAKPAVEAYCK